ncbi:hypothetical protein Bca52824_080888 [Brassica carinata]|uniref:RRM domain-containing protein n=1 Tax=Brassica carinata TaxID=52824 RepID=A0A8X7PHE5_BRACI|nr:hypothetical protein Bca52824_080888 [Brassica carinata]
MASANSLGKRKPEDDLDTEPVLGRHKSEAKETRSESQVELLETKSDESALNSAKETIEGLDEDPDFVEEAAGPPNKKLFLDKLSSQTEISDVIDFFKDVGQVVGVRLMLNHKGGRVDKRVGRRVENLLGIGFVEFASSDEAKKALKMKTGEYWRRNKVFLKVAATFLPPKYCVDHNVWYEDYLQREGLLIEGLDEIPDSAEEPAIPKKTLFVGRFSPQNKPKDIIDFFKDVGGVSYVRLIGDHTGKHVGYGFVILLLTFNFLFCSRSKTNIFFPDSIDFFKDVGQVVHVRLICNLMGNHVGTGFVEFASADEAKKALEKKNGEHFHRRKIFLDVPEKAQGRFNSKIFKDIVQVVRVRLIVDHCGEHVSCGFVEFASANEAQKALRHRK